MSRTPRAPDPGSIDVTYDVDPARVGALGGPDETEIRNIVAAALDEGGRAGVELSVVLVDDATLAELHGQQLGDPTPTDVMSFDLEGDEGTEAQSVGPVGEVYVSVDRAQAVASERGVRFARELALYLVHGTLHLCGHDDHEPDDRARMRAAETRVLTRLGFEADTAPHDIEG
ncbi:MAG: rRNA maturation RNase YbeY [Planctomycetaceae bacterium]|nr:rRNA maturation RNase YbeY [Planctomycetaceae bacterium]